MAYRLVKRIKIVDIAIVATSVLAAAGFWTRNFVLIAMIIPAGIILVKHRAATQKERDRREALSLYSLAISLLLPIVIIFIFILFFLFQIVPLIVKNWQI